MMKKLFSHESLFASESLAILRIVTGLLMAYHGLEVFNSAAMAEYAKWEIIKTLPLPEYIAYVGKGTELLTGLCFVFGIFTRLAALLMAVTMLFICFGIGNGRFYYEDQHPFLFSLIALLFFFTGPVKWSFDFKLFPPRDQQL